MRERGAPDDKNEYNLFVRNGVPNTGFKFFNQKYPYWLNESRKDSFWDTFSPILVVLLGWLFPKTIVFAHGWTHTKHRNFMKIGSTLRSVSRVLIHTYVYYII